MIDTTSKEYLALVSELYSRAISSVSEHYRRDGLTEMHVPVLVGVTGACENISSLFTVEGSHRVHMTQTGQLALEHALQLSTGVFCVTRSFRTDKIDERHLNEFTLIEEEFCWNHPSAGMQENLEYAPQMLSMLLKRIENAIKVIIGSAMSLRPDISAVITHASGYLERVLELPFNRVEYSDAIDLLSRFHPEKVHWGMDLKREHELQLVEIVAEQAGTPLLPTFVTGYPEAIKFFNMRRRRSNVSVVDSADLLLPQVGEAVGSALREDDYEQLEARLLQSTMFKHLVERQLGSLKDFSAYLDLVKEKKTEAHAGYGIGLERVIQFILGTPDIRVASVPFILSRMMGFESELQAIQSGSNAPGY